MNVNLARTFLELVAVRNFNKASERLHVTQSAVTMRINSLEEQLGQKLFIRSNTGVELTVAGRKFQPFAESLVQVWQQARQSLALPADISALFSIGCDAALWRGHFDEWLKRLRDEQPSVALEIEVRHSAYLMQRLALGLLHVAVVYDPQPHHGIVVDFLFEDKLLLVTREPREKVRWHPQYVFVQWSAEFRAQHDAIMPVDVTPPVVFADGPFALDYILKCGGSGYFPLRMVLEHLQAGRLFFVADTPVMSCNVHLAYSNTVAGHCWFQEARDCLEVIVAHHRELMQESLQSEYLRRWTGLAPQKEEDQAQLPTAGRLDRISESPPRGVPLPQNSRGVTRRYFIGE
jgi:LysR family transcriptional regulator, flagellar master operon regulator